MMRALWTAGSGMQAQQTNIDVISNNLANVNTTGYKKNRAEFQDLFYATLRDPNTVAGEGTLPVGLQVGHGVKTVATQTLFTQGSFQATGDDLDLTISGRGFFQVALPDGTTAYTRTGSFKVDAEGKVVTSDGYMLLPEMTVPENTEKILINPEGQVAALVPGSPEPEEVGQIELVNFLNPAGLNRIGQNLFKETVASGEAQTGNPNAEGFGSINQGFLEMSNVQVVEEMVNMIVAQRAYEINSKAIQVSDEMLGLANNLKR